MWEADTENCSICNAKFSRLAMRFRHHCRNCGLCVCGSCSTKQIVDVGKENAGKQEFKRVCRDCVSSAEEFNKVR